MIASPGSAFDLSNTKYSFGEFIGGGSFGIVCRATDSTGKSYAVKKIPLMPHINNRNLLNRVYREIYLMQKACNSDYVVKLIDAFAKFPNGEYEKDIYLVLEYMQSDLNKLLHSPLRDKNVLSLDHIKWFSCQLMRGLDYLHSAKPLPIIHRDLKPHNILLDESCNLKIADFGLARVSSENDMTEIMTGYVVSRAYRAPELVCGISPYSTAIDMWSVGCIVAECITGQCLFPAYNQMHLVHLMLMKLGRPPTSFISRIPNDRVRNWILTYQLCFRGDLDTAVRSLIYQNSRVRFGLDQVVAVNEYLSLVDFISNLLKYDSSHRMSAKNAQTHRFILSETRRLEKAPNLKLDDEFHLGDLLHVTESNLISAILKRIQNFQNS